MNVIKLEDEIAFKLTYQILPTSLKFKGYIYL